MCPSGGVQGKGEIAIAVDYARHFLLLVAAAGALALTDRWRQTVSAIPSFAFYGALHSMTLVIALRQPWAAWRKASFIAIAACLSMLSVVTALGLNHALGPRLGGWAVAVLLTLASGLGAGSYALLIRLFWIPALSRRALICIPLCCAMTTLAALPCGTYLHTVGGCWFAIIWWCTFSLTLCYYEGRVYRIEAQHVRHS